MRSLLFILLSLVIGSSAMMAQSLAFVEETEAAHELDAFSSHETISFDIIVEFGGSQRLKARMTLGTDSGAGLIEYDNGQKLLFKGDELYSTNGLSEKKGLRFTAYTWSYFFLFPYKLSDAGTNWEDYVANHRIGDKAHDTAKLTFEAGTGDAPDDWYIAYGDPDTHLIEVAAYIVTAGASQAEAEEDPHAIKYEDYRLIDGVPIAHEWTFWSWRSERGLTDRLGQASIHNVRFDEARDWRSTDGLIHLKK